MANVSIRNFQPVEVDVTLTLDTSIYATGDVLASTAAIPFESNPPPGGVRGKITQVTLYDRDDQGANLDLVFMKSSVSLGTLNAAPTISDDDAGNILRIVPVDSFVDLGGVRVASPAITQPIYFSVPSGTLYISAISRGTGTYTENGIRLKVFIEPANTP